ncbi:MAG: carnitine-CoA ligase [Rhodospirillaceae bacterium]|nr:carnitine-CoA ligase [Rhodospirillaceae bacterium]
MGSNQPAAPPDHGNIYDLLTRAAADDPSHIVCRLGDQVMTRADLVQRACAVARTLERRGLRRGERVAVMLDNSPDHLAVIFGLAKAGMVWVPVNTRQRGDGLAYVLEHSEPSMVLAEAAMAPVLEPALPERLKCAVLLRSADTGCALFGEPDAAAEPWGRAASAEGAAALLNISYTSGTTGRPKGVLVTHRMLQTATQAVLSLAEIRDGDRMIVWEPFFHIGGSQLIIIPLLHKVTLALVERFSASRFWDQVRENGASQLHYLGSVLPVLLKQQPGPEDRTHGARIAWGGGCPRDIWREVEERFALSIRECYGMTETSSIVSCNFTGKLGSVGRPLPWFEMKIVDEAGRTAAAGELGEIAVRERIPGVLFAGYFRDPSATAAALRDGLLYTGDLGSCDAEGDFYFHGRKTDSLRHRGENVSAFDVEHVVHQHPDVEECAVIGVPSELGEQDIKLFVRVKPGRVLMPAGLAAWCADRLADFQVPRYIVEIERFEKTASERIMKHALSRDTAGVWDRLAPTSANSDDGRKRGSP